MCSALFTLFLLVTILVLSSSSNVYATETATNYNLSGTNKSTGMIIDQVIKDPTGRNLVVQGSAIDDYIISSLLKLGIMSVYIREGNSDPDDPDAILSPKAAAMVKQLRTDDRSKVTLSDSVRQRVSTGVYSKNNSKYYEYYIVYLY
jgi:hypothetical protein